MPLFKIRPTDPSHTSAEVITRDAADILAIVQRLDCRAADIYRDGVYAYSIRLDDSGLWCICQRDQAEQTGEAISPTG